MTDTQKPNQAPMRKGHPWLRRIAISVTALITLVAVVYTVENWRGKREWERVRKNLETKGVVTDWSKYIPPAVPDDENVYKAPNMAKWFVGRGSSKIPGLTSFSDETKNRYTNAIGQITIISGATQAEGGI